MIISSFLFLQYGLKQENFERVIIIQWRQLQTWIIRKWTFKHQRQPEQIDVIVRMKVSLTTFLILNILSLSSMHTTSYKESQLIN